MNPVSVDIKDILVKECGFVFAQDLFISAIPAEPYNCVVIFDTSNEEIQNTYDNENYRFESVMIWVRDVDYESAYLKANSIVSILNNKANFVINGSRYLYCSMCSGINGIEGFADTNILTMNFRLQRKATNEFDTEYLTFEKLVNILKEGENITFTITPDKQIYINGGIPEAPIDGNQYARKDAGWVVISGGGGGGTSFWEVEDAINIKPVNGKKIKYETISNPPSIPTGGGGGFIQQALTDAATIAWDVDDGNLGTITIVGDRLLANPTNFTVGQELIIEITQGAGGSHLMTYDTYFTFSGGIVPILSSVEGQTDRLWFLIRSATEISFHTAEFNI